MEFMFVIVPLFIGVVFIVIISVIVYSACKTYGEWEHNNNQPQMSVPARVITKRTQTGGGWNNRPVSTSYFVTFELETGIRMEFPITGQQFGLLVESDRGTLTYQGTRYHDFVRIGGGDGWSNEKKTDNRS